MTTTNPSALEPRLDGRDLDERALVHRARAGEAGAFDALARAHLPPLYATAFHLVGNHEDAEDMVQECLVKAHLALRWYRGEGTLAGWLRRILVHLARDRFRRRVRRPVVAPLALGDEPRTNEGPAAEAGGRELQRLVAEGMERLPERLRIALALRTLDGLDYDAIAESTGVTPATARTHVMKARRALQRWLAPYLGRRER